MAFLGCCNTLLVIRQLPSYLCFSDHRRRSASMMPLTYIPNEKTRSVMYVFNSSKLLGPKCLTFDMSTSYIEYFNFDCKDTKK